MREIIFRGKRVENGEWVYGMPIWDESHPDPMRMIVANIEKYPHGNNWEVIHETVGQYTGLKDKHGKMIFEGDVVRFLDTNYGYNDEQVVMYSAGYFSPLVRVEENHNALDIYELGDYEIIGNIHDQKEDV